MKPFILFLLLLFGLSQIQGENIKIVKNYNLADRIALACDGRDWGIKDTLRMDGKVILLQKSPLLFLADTIAVPIFPELFPLKWNTMHVRPCARQFIASWVLENGRLYLEKVNPYLGARMKDLGILSENEDDEDSILIQNPGVSTMITPDGKVRGARPMIREDIASEGVIQKRIEKLTGEVFENGLLKASWVNGIVKGGGDFHFDGEMYLDEYMFMMKNGKVDGCQVVSIKPHKFNNIDQFGKYLSENVDWTTSQGKDILDIDMDVDSTGKVGDFSLSDFYSFQNKEMQSTQKINRDFVGSLMDAIKKIPENSFSIYFHFHLNTQKMLSYLIFIDPDKKEIKLVERDRWRQ